MLQSIHLSTIYYLSYYSKWLTKYPITHNLPIDNQSSVRKKDISVSESSASSSYLYNSVYSSLTDFPVILLMKLAFGVAQAPKLLASFQFLLHILEKECSSTLAPWSSH